MKWIFDSMQLYVCNIFASVLVNPIRCICQNDIQVRGIFTLKLIDCCIVNIQINKKNINAKKSNNNNIFYYLLSEISLKMDILRDFMQFAKINQSGLAYPR